MKLFIFFSGWSGCINHKLIWDCNENSTKLPLCFPQKVRKAPDIIPPTQFNPFILGENELSSHLYLSSVLLGSVMHVFSSTYHVFKLSMYAVSGNTCLTLIWCFSRGLNHAISGQTTPAPLNYCCSFTYLFLCSVFKCFNLFVYLLFVYF